MEDTYIYVQRSGLRVARRQTWASEWSRVRAGGGLVDPPRMPDFPGRLPAVRMVCGGKGSRCFEADHIWGETTSQPFREVVQHAFEPSDILRTHDGGCH